MGYDCKQTPSYKLEALTNPLQGDEILVKQYKMEEQ